MLAPSLAQTIQLIKERVPVEELAREAGLQLRQEGDEFKSPCPFHQDTDPSFSIYPSGKGWQLYKCFGCEAGGDVVDFYQSIRGVARAVAIQDLAARAGIDSTPGGDTVRRRPGSPRARRARECDGGLAGYPPASPRKEAELVALPGGLVPIPLGDKVMSDRISALHRHPEVLQFLQEKRKLTREIIERARLGYDETRERIVIPMIGPDGTVVRSRLYDWQKKFPGRKLIWGEGDRLPRLYPFWALEHDELLLCAGEMDCLAAWSLGIPAITGTGGEKKWSPIFTSALAGKRITICYDLDPEGQNGARLVAGDLVKVAAEVRILTLPLPWRQKGDPKDLTDWIIAGGTAEQLRELIAEASVVTGQAGESLPRSDVTLDDKGNARRLVDLHGRDLRYVKPWRDWLIWDGRRWQTDDTFEIERRAKHIADILYDDAAAAEDKERRELTAHAQRSAMARGIRAMIDLAKSEPGIAVTPAQLDVDPWVLNCQNGTLDLRTGKLHPHRREDLLTKVLPVDYDPDAECPTWEGFLNRIMAGKQDLINFLQRAVGYSLTGDVSEQVMFVLYGGGANGKSTFLETISSLLMEYSVQTPTDTLMVKRSTNGATGDLARLKGARFISAAEADEGRQLSEALVKQLTGGDVITARFLYGDLFDFKMTGKIWLATNHKPVIRGADEAIWRRIRLVPFAVTIPETERDRQLPEKLRAELAGILRWAVTGCLAWQRSGLGVPEEIQSATGRYKAEMDLLAAFLDDCCMVGDQYTVTAKELHLAFCTWAEESKEPVISKRMMADRLAEKGFQPFRQTGGGRCWRGLSLKGYQFRS